MNPSENPSENPSMDCENTFTKIISHVNEPELIPLHDIFVSMEDLSSSIPLPYDPLGIDPDVFPVLWDILFDDEFPDVFKDDMIDFIEPLALVPDTSKSRELTAPKTNKRPMAKRSHRCPKKTKVMKITVEDMMTENLVFRQAHGRRRICKIYGCTRVDRGKGLCGAHGGGRRCKNIKCTKASRKYGYCSTHNPSRADIK